MRKAKSASKKSKSAVRGRASRKKSSRTQFKFGGLKKVNNLNVYASVNKT